MATDESEQECDQTVTVYLGKVSNAWGRSDVLVVGSMEKAKEDVEERARDLASYNEDAELPDEAEWRNHFCEDGTQVWDVRDWQIVVQTHEVSV